MNSDALFQKIMMKRNPFIVGLDLKYEELPENFRESFESKGEAVRAYNRKVIDGVCNIAPAIGLNAAVLSLYGEETLYDAASYAKEKGLFVLADIKLAGDAVTSAAAAELWFENIGADAVTAVAYYGEEGLAPLFEKAKEKEKLVFVISHSETGSHADMQELMAGLRMAYRVVCEKAAMWGEKYVGKFGYSDIGVALGGISNEKLREIRFACKKTPILLTGYNGKKVCGDTIAGAFDMRGLGCIVYVTRLITLAEDISAAASAVHKDLQTI